MVSLFLPDSWYKLYMNYLFIYLSKLCNVLFPMRMCKKHANIVIWWCKRFEIQVFDKHINTINFYDWAMSYTQIHILQAHYQSISFAPFTSAFLACFWAMIIPPARATIAFIIWAPRPAVFASSYGET